MPSSQPTPVAPGPYELPEPGRKVGHPRDVGQLEPGRLVVDRAQSDLHPRHPAAEFPRRPGSRRRRPRRRALEHLAPRVALELVSPALPQIAGEGRNPAGCGRAEVTASQTSSMPDGYSCERDCTRAGSPSRSVVARRGSRRRSGHSRRPVSVLLCVGRFGGRDGRRVVGPVERMPLRRPRSSPRCASRAGRVRVRCPGHPGAAARSVGRGRTTHPPPPAGPDRRRRGASPRPLPHVREAGVAEHAQVLRDGRLARCRTRAGSRRRSRPRSARRRRAARERDAGPGRPGRRVRAWFDDCAIAYISQE